MEHGKRPYEQRHVDWLCREMEVKPDAKIRDILRLRLVEQLPFLAIARAVAMEQAAVRQCLSRFWKQVDLQLGEKTERAWAAGLAEAMQAADAEQDQPEPPSEQAGTILDAVRGPRRSDPPVPTVTRDPLVTRDWLTALICRREVIRREAPEKPWNRYAVPAVFYISAPDAESARHAVGTVIRGALAGVEPESLAFRLSADPPTKQAKEP